ncbi:DUF3618 domain-containing protein [Myceligenerans pegani]|uniref:DUF3618 domain-containing protein n=1 Tax=Myceligenerans pegani TaxID=2776917 RepID=A0ABR9MTV7_9MICO|nr:DUF3618 domain-containing protein [Myceligenerans sp. TRM 65318]MBE1874389.1 DUF3618 domain-containing protein [Myceligenerans sp. TRM 65318]MBE3016660.1 DUF3618 domain-containing protein [Myceligenerans sp. TRM 65318]
MSTEDKARRSPSKEELEAEVLRTRAELAATIDQLTLKINPAHQAQRFARNARQAAAGAGSRAAGAFQRDKRNPVPEGHRVRNTKLLVGTALGLAALGAVTITVVVLRRARG